jgi:hypothetical protein
MVNIRMNILLLAHMKLMGRSLHEGNTPEMTKTSDPLNIQQLPLVHIP